MPVYIADVHTTMHSYGRIRGEEALLTFLLHGLHAKDLFPATHSVTGGRTRKGGDTRPLSITCGAALLRWNRFAQGVYWRPPPASRPNGVNVNVLSLHNEYLGPEHFVGPVVRRCNEGIL